MGAAIVGCGAAVTTPATPAASPEPTAITIDDGVWIVGSQVVAGTYSNGGGGREMCYWARLRGFSGQLTDLIVNGISDAPQIVTIRPGDIGFESSGCGTWTRLE